jgi:hypothetical protein
MTVIAFPRNLRPAHQPEVRQPTADRLRGIEQCLISLAGEAEELGLDLLAHMIAVAREEARDSRRELAQN